MMLALVMHFINVVGTGGARTCRFLILFFILGLGVVRASYHDLSWVVRYQ